MREFSELFKYMYMYLPSSIQKITKNSYNKKKNSQFNEIKKNVF